MSTFDLHGAVPKIAWSKSDEEENMSSIDTYTRRGSASKLNQEENTYEVTNSLEMPVTDRLDITVDWDQWSKGV